MPNTLEIIADNPNEVRKQWLSPETAIQEVVAFQQRFGIKHIWLACHAAFPLILTPELLNLTHINFLDDKKIPWIAEADFLLSPLCREIDDGVFEVEPGVREVLLVKLKQQFRSQRLLELAYFLTTFLDEKPDRNQRPDIAQTHQWIARAYTDPDSVIEGMSEFLEKRVFTKTESLLSLSSQIQIATISEILAEPLERTNLRMEYQQIKDNSRILAHVLYGDEEKLRQKIAQDIRNQKISERDSGKILPGVFQWLKQELQITEITTERVGSELFVGFKEVLERFKQALSSESEIQMLNVHTNGDGGLGKTHLLLRMRKHCASVSDGVVFAKEIIDFYDIESHSRFGVIQQIVNNLGVENFPEFKKSTGWYPNIEESFWKEYAAFAVKMRLENKVIVLFFDSYENIQRTEIIGKEQKYAEATAFSQWIETQLCPRIAENTRLIVSGRYPLQQIDRDRITIEELQLSHFALADTIEFWKKRFNVETDKELAEQIGSGDLIEPLHALANGRPIL
ncbi:MAG: hypothetical protein GY797_09700, partial [Deltaproteobacteria bacterium]|nr:hypothetical protein [Deltaproteobacteria bacterium]